jgi:dipeptidyl aminopeptidase/acylaminoacyl peptidase
MPSRSGGAGGPPPSSRVGSLTRLSVSVLLASVVAGGAAAQRPSAPVSAADYARAEQYLPWNIRSLVSHDEVEPHWLENDRFWYRDHLGEGAEFIVVDPSAGTRRALFDHARLAAALSVAADSSFEPYKLPFRDLKIAEVGRSVRFELKGRKGWSCDITAYHCTRLDSAVLDSVSEVRSPDGKWVAFARDHNLWVRSLSSREGVQLTQDGTPDYGYATNDFCCNQVTAPRQHRGRRPILVWSPDSRRIATLRYDQRNVKELHLLETAKGRPILHSYRYALPGDSIIPRYDLYLLDVASRAKVRVEVPPIEMVNTSCCGPLADTVWKDVRWGSGSDEVFFTRGRRDFKQLELLAANATTGAVRTILKETGKTFVELNLKAGGVPNWRVINRNTEVVWFSERDGFGHLYLYDATTGALKRQITSGPWLVVDLLHVDEAGRWVYFTAVAREASGDPYFRHVYRAALDASSTQLVTPENADHEAVFSPAGAYLIDTYSRRDTLPVTVLRTPDGRVLQRLETADISRLLTTGWRPPTAYTVKARDGVSDVSGFLYFPTRFNATGRYPVVDYIYPGPQIGPIGFRNFAAAGRGNTQALAELGFIVFTIDAMGTPLRSKAFHDAYYGNMGDNGIPDHIAALQQLARRYLQMDLDRVGIFGHSGGGFSSTDAILRFPDFFKVAVSSAGNHDNRSYDYTWGEKYQGLLVGRPDGGDSFDSQANELLAKSLKGKLLLAYGTLDDNVHPNATLLVIDELIKQNKDFDLLVFPNRNHGYASEPYLIRRTWDYFVRHLLGVEPPSYEIKAPPAEPS